MSAAGLMRRIRTGTGCMPSLCGCFRRTVRVAGRALAHFIAGVVHGLLNIVLCLRQRLFKFQKPASSPLAEGACEFIKVRSHYH